MRSTTSTYTRVMALMLVGLSRIMGCQTKERNSQKRKRRKRSKRNARRKEQFLRGGSSSAPFVVGAFFADEIGDPTHCFAIAKGKRG